MFDGSRGRSVFISIDKNLALLVILAVWQALEPDTTVGPIELWQAPEREPCDFAIEPNHLVSDLV